MFNIVRNACWMRGAPSCSAVAKFLLVREVKIVGKSVVLSLQMCEMETAEEILNTSSVTVL